MSGGKLVANRTTSFANYDRYLEAKQLIRTREGLEQAAEILQDLIVREPDFAPAWASLSIVLNLILRN